MHRIISEISSATFLLTLFTEVLYISGDAYLHGYWDELSLTPRLFIPSFNEILSQGFIMLFIGGIPKSVLAQRETILKSEEKSNILKIISSLQYFKPCVIQSAVILRNGRHLIFECRLEDRFQPTISHSPPAHTEKAWQACFTTVPHSPTAGRVRLFRKPSTLN